MVKDWFGTFLPGFNHILPLDSSPFDSDEAGHVGRKAGRPGATPVGGIAGLVRNEEG